MKPQPQQINNSTNLRSIAGGGVLPQAVEIENAVLGACLVDNDVVFDVVARIPAPEVFYDTRNQSVFKAISNLIADMAPVDLLSVSQELKRINAIDKVGGDMYLVELSQKIATTAHVEHHCLLIIQEYLKRETISMSQRVINKMYDPTNDVHDVIASASNALSLLQDQVLMGSAQLSFSDALEKVKQRVEFLTNQESGTISGVTSGLSKIDQFTSGWQPGQLVTIGARPGMGKTSFIMGNLIGAAKQKKPVGFISIEMTTVELVARSVAIDSHFHLSQLLTKGFEKLEYFNQLNDVIYKMKRYNCHFNDSVKDISDIIATARKWKREHNIEVLFIDYLQLITDQSMSGKIREQEIGSITRKLKSLAKELQIPLIVPCQLSRETEKRGGARRPILSDLRESGSIEQDSDIVAFIHRPEYYGQDVSEDFDMVEQRCNSEFIIAKFRNGGTGTVLMYWQGDKTRFYNEELKSEYTEQMPSEKFTGRSASDAFGNDQTPF